MNTDTFIETYFRFPFDDTIEQIYGFNRLTLDAVRPILSLISTGERNHISVEEQRDIYSADDFSTEFQDISKPNLLIICIKDNSKLLSFCLEQIQLQDINSYCDIIIIDDRPESNDNAIIAQKFRCNYIKVKNNNNIFNYSILNNIAACFAKVWNKKRTIFWNSDLWATNHDTLINLMHKHDQYNSSITGAKLVYPSKEFYSSILGKNSHVLGKNIEHSYNTIQHGGIIYVPYRPEIYTSPIYHPIHQWRFYDPSHPLANIDTKCLAVTGAIHIINTDDFIELGGYSCALCAAFQDIDLCQRAVEKNKTVFYVGSETLLHGETITNEDGKNFSKSSICISDKLIYEYVWPTKKMRHLLGIQK